MGHSSGDHDRATTQETVSGRQQSNQGRKESPQSKGQHETSAPKGQTDRPGGLGCGTEAELLSGMAEVLVSIPGTQSCKTQGPKSVSLIGQSEGTWWCLSVPQHSQEAARCGVPQKEGAAAQNGLPNTSVSVTAKSNSGSRGLISPFSSESITEGSQGRTLEAGLKQRPWRNTCSP